MGQVLCPEKRQEKHRGTGVHRSTHPQGQGEQGGQDAPTHRSHSTTQTHHRQGRQGTGHTTGQTHRNSAGRAHSTPQDRGTAPHRSTAHRRKHKRVHKSTSRCAIVVAWSTRGQTTRSHPTTPLAPLREDMAQGIRACAVSSFACRRGTASP